MNEQEIVEAIAKWVPKSSPSVKCGIGDDAAVLESLSGKTVTTVDRLVEGVHFDLKYGTLSEVGQKAMAVNLSDLAAMGATGRYAIISLSLPKKSELKSVAQLYRGLILGAKNEGVEIVGGNLTVSKQWIVDVFMLGHCERPILRSGAKPGEWIGVTGKLGQAAAGLWSLRRQKRNPRSGVQKAQLTPLARLKEGRALAAAGVTAMIDVSDSFATSVFHLARASEVGMEISATNIPTTEPMRDLATIAKVDPLEWALYGGEDYELLFTFPPEKLTAIQRALQGTKCPFSVVGKVGARTDGVILKSGGQDKSLRFKGWDPF